MSALNEPKGKYGHGTMHTAPPALRTPRLGDSLQMMSHSYTTRIEQLWRVYSTSHLSLAYARAAATDQNPHVVDLRNDRVPGSGITHHGFGY